MKIFFSADLEKVPPFVDLAVQHTEKPYISDSHIYLILKSRNVFHIFSTSNSLGSQEYGTVEVLVSVKFLVLVNE